MILEEATLEAFGYEVWELTPHGHKPILAACDKCGKVRKTSKSQYHALCNSCAKKRETLTEEHKANMSAARKGNTNALGHTFREEQSAILSASLKGKKRTEETKALISAAMRGENHWNWQGGISFEPYCIKFNNAFKEYIRAKFGYTCFLCPTTQAENGRKLSVHHVNYNKQCGCDGDKTCNFVPLCKKCHSKTNANRDYWQKLITDKLHCLIIGWDI